MAKERVFLTRNTGTQAAPIWEKWFTKTVADAVLMSDADGETKNIKQYMDEKITTLIGGAPETADTLKELFDLISDNKSIADALNSAIANKADKVHNHDTVYAGKTHGHAISEVTNLQTTLDGKAASGHNHDASYLGIGATAANASKVGGFTVAKDVPADAEFTDTKYTHPDNATTRHVSDTEKAIWNGKTDDTALNTHKSDTTSHITATERNTWNAKQGALTIDTAMSTTSTNPVQNKVIQTALDGKAGTATATSSANGLMSKDDKKRLDISAPVYFGSDLPTDAPTGSICFLTE